MARVKIFFLWVDEIDEVKMWEFALTRVLIHFRGFSPEKHPPALRGGAIDPVKGLDLLALKLMTCCFYLTIFDGLACWSGFKLAEHEIVYFFSEVNDLIVPAGDVSLDFSAAGLGWENDVFLTVLDSPMMIANVVRVHGKFRRARTDKKIPS